MHELERRRDGHLEALIHRLQLCRAVQQPKRPLRGHLDLALTLAPRLRPPRRGADGRGWRRPHHRRAKRPERRRAVGELHAGETALDERAGVQAGGVPTLAGHRGSSRAVSRTPAAARPIGVHGQAGESEPRDARARGGAALALGRRRLDQDQGELV